MPYLTQLANVARRTGYPVTEVSGWKNRGHGPQLQVLGVVCHHTAGPAAGGDYPSLRVVRDGRSGLPGPLSQFGLGRSGRIYVVAAGRCWHNAPSTSPYHRNDTSLGIEAENNGSQAWPAAQLDAYRKLCAELCKEFDLPANRVKAHREVNTAKPDPHGIDMGDFRAAVGRLITREDDDMPEYVSVGTGPETQDLEPGEWQAVAWPTEYSDPSGQHGGEGLSVLTGPAKYTLSAYVRVEGLPLGTPVQIRAVEVKPDPDGPDPIAQIGPVAERVAPDVDYTIADLVDAGNKLRVQLLVPAAAKVAGGTCKVHFWR